MKLRSKAPILRDWEGTAHFVTTPPVSRDGNPVLVLDGIEERPVGPAEAHGHGYEVVQATDEELDMLRKGGYGIPYLGKRR
jgi:hypothetical protein